MIDSKGLLFLWLHLSVDRLGSSWILALDQSNFIRSGITHATIYIRAAVMDSNYLRRGNKESLESTMSMSIESIPDIMAENCSRESPS